MEESIWFVPWGAATGTLQSIYEASEGAPDAPTTIAAGRAFSISLDALSLAAQKSAPWYARLTQPDTDVLILTSSALGSKPLVDRVHYYQPNVDPSRPLLAHDLLSDLVWVCDDYHDPDPFYMELQVVMIQRADEHRVAALKGFATLVGTAGSVFPVAFPYLALGQDLLTKLDDLWINNQQKETYLISEPIKLFPPRTPHAKTIRAGRYVVLSERIDGTQLQLADNGAVTTLAGDAPTGPSGAPLSYAVLRIDPTREAPMDFVVSQRVATLLTQLKNDRDGKPAGALETSFGFLTDTLQAYTSYTDLRRYKALSQKGDARTPGETQQMQQLAQRPDLKPFLPAAPPPGTPLPGGLASPAAKAAG